MLSIIVTGIVIPVIHDELRHARWRRERGKAANMELIDQGAPQWMLALHQQFIHI
jgi:hypothetical protein